MNKNLLERYNVAVKSLVVYLRDENEKTEAELKEAIVKLVKGMKEKKWTKLSCSKKQDVWKIRRKVLDSSSKNYRTEDLWSIVKFA